MVFGRCLGHEGGILLSGTNALTARPHRAPSPLCHARTQREGTSHAPGGGSSLEPDRADTPIRTSSLENWERWASVLHELLTRWCFVTAANRLRPTLTVMPMNLGV